MKNIDKKTVEDFGEEWNKYNQSSIKQAGNRSDSILKLSIEKPCYNSYPPSISERMELIK